MKKYDVFISYRRDGGGKELARILDAELERLHYRSFLDFNELKTSTFGPQIISAIDSAPVFLFILSEGALDRCANEDDWVRKEIMYAISKGKHIVPVNPDGKFKTFPAGIPQEIVSVLGDTQHSDLMLGQLFKASVKKIVKDRIEPHAPRVIWMKRCMSVAVTAVLVAVAYIGISGWGEYRNVMEDADAYSGMIMEAKAMISVPDSSCSVAVLLNRADSLAGVYAGTRNEHLFGNEASSIKDSLFNVYKQQFEFHHGRFIDSFDQAEKQAALEYVEKALQIKDAEYLKTMRNVLNK